MTEWIPTHVYISRDENFFSLEMFIMKDDLA